MKSKPWSKWVIGLCLLSMLVGLAGCGGAAVTPTETPTPSPDFGLFNCTGTPPVSEAASNGFYIDDQVIVIGPSANIDEIVKSFVVNGVTVGFNSDSLIEDCSLSYLADGRQFQQRGPLFDNKVKVETIFSNSELSDAERNSLVMRLYSIPHNDGYTVDDVSKQINASGVGKYVYADPNYLTDPSVGYTGSCGDPFSGGGSPFSGGGSTYAEPGTVSGPIPVSLANQWAFLDNQGGISFLKASNPPSFTDTGQGVRVGVFDTLPESIVSRGIAPEKTITIAPPSNAPRFDLYVSSSINAQITPKNPPGYDISEHGLFVAGLVQTIAPKSEIHLIRVLNQDGCGDLFAISKAIHDFTSRMSAYKARPNLEKVVINLSLGVHQPYEEPTALNREKLDSLVEAIGDAYDLGATIIAAAGNDSLAGGPAVMQLPAAYENVIGVAANDKDGARSCYSNSGDVAAPGGNGGGALPSSNGCVARVTTWNVPPTICSGTDMAQCGYGLIGLSKPIPVASLIGTVTYSTNYIFWVGTSFSTPLVTGLAVLLSENNNNQIQVKCRILQGATPVLKANGTTDTSVSGGKINVNNSMSLITAPCP